MRQATPTKRQIQVHKNYMLLHAARGMSPGRAAAKLAEQNKSILPSSLERTNPTKEGREEEIEPRTFRNKNVRTLLQMKCPDILKMICT